MNRFTWTSEHKHLAAALLLGLVARGVVAFFGYGPMALDDYQHVLVPARDVFLGNVPTVPPFRSYLPVWLISQLLSLGSLLGIDANPVSQVRFVGLACGVISLSSVLAFFAYARRRGSGRFAILGSYVLALHFLLPFTETRVFGESLSLPFVVGALVLAELAVDSGSRRWLLLSAALLAFASLLRFQNLVCLGGYALGLLIARKPREFWILSTVGLALFVVGQIGVDMLGGRTPFATVLAYFEETVGSRKVPEHQAWFVFVGIVFVAYLLPFSLPLFAKVKAVWKAHWRFLFPAVVFLIVHSVIQHKEERFLIPVIPIFLVALAALWDLAWDRKVVRRFVTPALIALNALLLTLACTNNSQAGFFEPIVAFQRKFDRGLCLEVGHAHLGTIQWIQTFFVWKPIKFQAVETTALTAPAIAQRLKASEERAAVIISDNPADIASLENLAENKGAELRCDRVLQSSPLVDRLIYRANPLRNPRRSPRYSIACELG